MKNISFARFCVCACYAFFYCCILLCAASQTIFKCRLNIYFLFYDSYNDKILTLNSAYQKSLILFYYTFVWLSFKSIDLSNDVPWNFPRKRWKLWKKERMNYGQGEIFKIVIPLLCDSSDRRRIIHSFALLSLDMRGTNKDSNEFFNGTQMF